MAVRTYCTIVIIVLSLSKCGDFNLMLLLFCLTKSKMRYCPTAYTIAIAIKVTNPQMVDTLIRSEMLLSDISIINEEITIEMMTKNFVLLYPVADTWKRIVIYWSLYAYLYLINLFSIDLL
jgi:hypothetical protein